MKPRVMLSVPNQNWVHKDVVWVLLDLQKDTRVELNLLMPNHKPYENNQHHLVKELLDGNYDFWVSIDTDNPPQRNPIDLIFLDKDIIGCPTPVWYCHPDHPDDTPFYWNVYYAVEDGYKPWKAPYHLQRVNAIGTGCFVVARRVFEHPGLQRGAFARTVNCDGTVERGNDISFCERATECGFEIYAHYDYPCKHFNEVELTDVITRYAKR